MTPKDRTYLSCHFHDFVCVDWQYSREEQRLQLRIRDDWDNEENSDTFLLKFEGIRYYSMEAENHHPNPPLFWIISTAFTTSERKKRLEKHFDEPLFQYEIWLSNGYVEIICADIHAERLKEESPPYTPDSSWTPPPPPEPFPPEEREALILEAAQNHTYPFSDYDRAEETLRLMEENKDPELPGLARAILHLDEPNFWDIAVRILGRIGTAEDLPLLYAQIPGTKQHPDRRKLLLNTIDLLAVKNN